MASTPLKLPSPLRIRLSHRLRFQSILNPLSPSSLLPSSLSQPSYHLSFRSVRAASTFLSHKPASPLFVRLSRYVCFLSFQNPPPPSSSSPLSLAPLEPLSSLSICSSHLLCFQSIPNPPYPS
uniref:Uncharacterized protein n=1 Tax=Kalanchoe fedtschenkoi TaxID=63787 RepID=A0A7N0UU97_KALFE